MPVLFLTTSPHHTWVTAPTSYLLADVRTAVGDETGAAVRNGVATPLSVDIGIGVVAHEAAASLSCRGFEFLWHAGQPLLDRSETALGVTVRPAVSLTVLVGLPGSGKSSWIDADPRVPDDVFYFDDFQNNAHGDRPEPRFSRNLEGTVEALGQGRSGVVADINYCRTEILDELVGLIGERAPFAEVDVIYFANDPQACKANVFTRRRDSLIRDLSMVIELTGVYDPPAGALPVWRPADA